ncbi:protein kinase domain-containing protein [Ferruginibacter albus]|uniref:protein kinase domain-containing protein n=1 Tax=Ferruginibacter albus TaxID=2875540 RepID=UPI001CC68631|nr:protein kinase [Ferruginibacter albus]UAY51882.1 protein kinase [Ferruginibacter albus]
MVVTLGNGIRIEASDGEQYRIIQFLGAGGNCQVYLAISTKGKWQGILFAVKFFFKIEDSERLQQFEKEKKFLFSISHPSIMKIYSEGSYYLTSLDKKIPFVVCDYFPDRLDWKIRNKKLRHSEKLIYITQLLSAIDFLEKNSPKIVHRDIKPQNIFIKGYTCVLGDFGLMKDLSDGICSDEEDLFKKSKGVGMPRSYRTPDLVKYAKKEKILTTASDVFQLGLVAAEMFTGANLLKPTEKDLLEDINLDPLRDVIGQEGKLIKDLIQKMLVIESTNRGKISELLDGFDGALRATTTKQIEIDGFAF